MCLSWSTGKLLKLIGTGTRHEGTDVQMCFVARTCNKWPSSLTDDDYEHYSFRYTNACKLSIKPEEKNMVIHVWCTQNRRATHVALSVLNCAQPLSRFVGLSALLQFAGLLWYTWFPAENRRNGRLNSTCLRQVWWLLVRTCILLNLLKPKTYFMYLTYLLRGAESFLRS